MSKGHAQDWCLTFCEKWKVNSSLHCQNDEVSWSFFYFFLLFSYLICSPHLHTFSHVVFRLVTKKLPSSINEGYNKEWSWPLGKLISKVRWYFLGMSFIHSTYVSPGFWPTNSCSCLFVTWQTSSFSLLSYCLWQQCIYPCHTFYKVKAKCEYFIFSCFIINNLTVFLMIT